MLLEDLMGASLPEGAQRLMALVARSAPSADRPRLGEEYEAMLRSSDIDRAACYASMEDLSDRLDRIARALAEDHTAVPVYVDTEDEDSLVVRVEEAISR
jgi:hypothetical protein